MTWKFEIKDDGETMDVYDHNDDIVAKDVYFGGQWEGDYPNEIMTVMREEMDGDQPSAYNQSLLADAATENIERKDTS